nr:MAG TPA: hypothetical protein [Bacteriophage sp.]
MRSDYIFTLIGCLPFRIRLNPTPNRIVVERFSFETSLLITHG